MVKSAVRSLAVSVVLLASAVVSSCSGGGPTTDESRFVDRGTVVEVVDGDTVRLEIAGSRESVRLIGVDAPETKHPTKGVQCFGPEAAEFLARLLPPGTPLRLERDEEARDAYDRLLLYIFVSAPEGERFVNLELAARGHARPLSIEPNVRYRGLFVAAAFDAERNRRGLWGRCK